MSKTKPAERAATGEKPPEETAAATAPAGQVVPAADPPHPPPPPPEPQPKADRPEETGTAAGLDPDTASSSPRPRAIMPNAEAAAAISAFLADWREGVPADAAHGQYSPHGRDRFVDQDYSQIPDGTVFSRGWVFIFEDGRFVGAADMSTARSDVFVPRGQHVTIDAA